MGSWLTYGLGTENKNLPGFVVLCPEVPLPSGRRYGAPASFRLVNQATYVSTRYRRSSERTSIRTN